MRTPTGAAGLIVAALFLTACDSTTGPNVDAGPGRTEAPAIGATPSQLLFRIYAFDPSRDPPAQILQVSDGGTLNWKADTHTSWITLWHSGAPGRLVVGLDRTHMNLLASDNDRPPVLRTTITLSAAGASNSPVLIPVVVLISYLPPDKLGPGGSPDPRE